MSVDETWMSNMTGTLSRPEKGTAQLFSPQCTHLTASCAASCPGRHHPPPHPARQQPLCVRGQSEMLHFDQSFPCLELFELRRRTDKQTNTHKDPQTFPFWLESRFGENPYGNLGLLEVNS